MKVNTVENPRNLETTVFIVFKRVIHKLVFDSKGSRKEDIVLHCHCPMCKHFVVCSGSKVWYAKQMGECGDFETE